MTTKSFSISEALRFGWAVTKSNFGFFILLLIVSGLFIFISYVGYMVVMLQINPFLGITSSIAYFFFVILFSMGLVKTALRFCDQEKGKIGDLFSQHRSIFNYLLAYILYMLIVIAGTILLIIPGIILAIKFRFFDHFIVDKGLGPIEALKKSYAITQGVKWQLFVFFIVVVLANTLGAFLLLVGLFVTIPTTMLATAFVYRKLLAQTEIAPVSQASPETAT